MGRRHLARRGNGRFTRPTIEGMFGLKILACPKCGILNPHGVREPAPERCHDCGASMVAVEAPVQAPVQALVRGSCARCRGTGEVWNGPEPGRDWWADPCPECVQENTCPRCGGELDGNCECPAAACGWPD